MAQVLTAKRQAIAAAAVASATALLDAESGLQAASTQSAQAGSFDDSEFTLPTLQHLTAFLVGEVLSTLVPDIESFLSGHLQNNNALPIRRDLLLQMRAT